MTNSINIFLNAAKSILDKTFMEKANTSTSLKEIYPFDYESSSFDTKPIDNLNKLSDDLGILYEEMIPIKIKKDLGQFYTRDSSIVDSMVNELDLTHGLILEPSCGSGLFAVRVVKRMIGNAKEQGLSAKDTIDYIVKHLYLNDLDKTATEITEINILATMLPLIIDSFSSFGYFSVSKMKLTNYDFTQKGLFTNKFSIVLGNPPFVTLYGKRSRNMNEEKRAYYNTFDFVQNKSGNNKFNVAMFFIENGMDSLCQSGKLFFILDISFFETAYKDLRKYLVQNYKILSITAGLKAFDNVASGQILLLIQKNKSNGSDVEWFDFEKKSKTLISQKTWDDADNDYKFSIPLNDIENQIDKKINLFKKLDFYYPDKCLRTCCALTGKTESFIVSQDKQTDNYIFPFLEGSKGLKKKFGELTAQRFIEYDYSLQLKLSDEFKVELEKQSVKNKKRVTLGDKDSYLSPKIFIRQSAFEIIATYTERPFAANNSLYVLTDKKNDIVHKNQLKYICGLLNSDLISFYCLVHKIIRAEKGKTPQIKISDLKKIRIFISKEFFDSMIQLVDCLLENNQYEENMKKINELVYLIYDIDKEEIKYITNYLKNR